jgi:outer membrane scaffolding protein for murein synthesis (MipA/OmpV family)
MLGAGGAMRPTFEGSDRYTGKPLPVFSLRWRDTIALGEGGLSVYWRHRGFRVGGGLTFDPGRRDHNSGGIFDSGDDRLKGLGKIDASLGLRGFMDYRLGPAVFAVSGTKYTGAQNDGVVVDFGLSMPLPVGRRLIVTPHVRANWASGAYMQTYFGVTPIQSAASIFPVFNAGSGFKDVRSGVNILYRLTPHWYLGADASAIRLLGSAAKSPISISDSNAAVMSFVGYRF